MVIVEDRMIRSGLSVQFLATGNSMVIVYSDAQSSDLFLLIVTQALHSCFRFWGILFYQLSVLTCYCRLSKGNPSRSS